MWLAKKISILFIKKNIICKKIGKIPFIFKSEALTRTIPVCQLRVKTLQKIYYEKYHNLICDIVFQPQFIKTRKCIFLKILLGIKIQF